MNYIDIVILLFLLYGAFRGFSKGLIIEVATLAGLILGVFIAIRYSPFTEGILKDLSLIPPRYRKIFHYGLCTFNDCRCFER